MVVVWCVSLWCMGTLGLKRILTNSLTNKLFSAVLAEAQVVCAGQPLLIVGDINADPGIFLCLAKSIS